jgi:hypothetical protein
MVSNLTFMKFIKSHYIMLPNMGTLKLWKLCCKTKTSKLTFWIVQEELLYIMQSVTVRKGGTLHMSDV